MPRTIAPFSLRLGTAFLLVIATSIMQAQAQPPASPAPDLNAAPAATLAKDAVQAKAVRNSDRRKAAKLFLAASKLFEKEQFEEALQRYERAAALDPGNADYPLAVSVARSHLVTALVQAAAKNRLRGDQAAARASLAQALQLDPKNLQVSQHLNELGNDALRGLTKPLYEQDAETGGADSVLAPAPGVHSFHLRTDRRQIIQQVFKAYGIEVTLDQSVRSD